MQKARKMWPINKRAKTDKSSWLRDNSDAEVYKQGV